MSASRFLVVDDGQLAAEVERAVTNGDGGGHVESCADLAQAIKVLGHEEPFDVLVGGPGVATAANLERLAAAHDEAPAMAVVLALPRTHRMTLRALVRTGALELIYLPSRPEELARALARAVEVANRLGQSSHGSAPRAEERPNGPGTVITIASATGGCGKTFLATNLACFYANQVGRRTCILDLDLQFGEVATALRLRPRFTIADALQLRDEDQDELAEHLDDYLVRHETGPWLLAAPKDPVEADRIEPAEVSRIIEIARQHFDIVIVDTPAALTEVVLAAFDRSQILYTVATLDTPSVRNLGVFLHTLERLKIPSDNVRLVLNKAEKDVGIEVDQVTRLFPQGFQSVLPYAKEVSRSINVGMPVVASSPSCEVSRLMLAGFAQLLGDEERAGMDAQQAQGRPARRWWRLGR